MDLQDEGKISRARLVVRKTRFDYPYQDDYAQMIAALVDDGDRNRLIASDAVDFHSEGAETALVVSDRKSHCRKLASLMADKGARVGVLTGDLPDAKPQGDRASGERRRGGYPGGHDPVDRGRF